MSQSEEFLKLLVRNIAKRHVDEVFSVVSDKGECIIRMNKDVAEMRGSSIFIPKLAALGIIVPRMIAEDYNVSKTGFGYQVLERLPGTDLGNVIETLSTEQLTTIAQSVADIFRRLKSLSTDGTYGLVTNENGADFSNWKEWIDYDLATAVARAEETGLSNDAEDLTGQVSSIIRRYDDYFRKVPSTVYYGDIAGKNVLVADGKFSGLVDLDALAHGDWLEAVGRIRASWYGTDYGETYTNAVMDALELSDEQREIVCMYSLYHRYVWMCENGMKFNENTTGVINQDKLKTDLAVIQSMIAELQP